jgi:dTDP-4-amino-4,6-dideoxygalactose transaminase
MRFIGHSRGAVMVPGFGRTHTVAGYAHRMPGCTAAICLGQLEIIREQVAHRDHMARLLTELISDIPGIIPLPLPDYMNVYSCWMFGLSIDPAQFRCSTAELAQQMDQAGIPGAGTGEYYLMPAALTFLQEKARDGIYPYSMPPASREYSYSAASCPTARDFLKSFIRWATFCEKYQPEHCEIAADIIRSVAERNRI